MTIHNTELHDVYMDAKDGAYGDLIKKIANGVDDAIGEMLNSLKYDGVAFPGDDRCMNIELEVFKVALDRAGYNWLVLAGVSELV